MYKTQNTAAGCNISNSSAFRGAQGRNIDFMSQRLDIDIQSQNIVSQPNEFSQQRPKSVVANQYFKGRNFQRNVNTSTGRRQPG